VLAYGCWIGFIGGLVRTWTAVPMMRAGAIVVVLLAVADFEHQFIKGFAALNLNAVVTLAMLAVIGPQMVRLLGLVSAEPRAATAAPVEVPR